MKPSHLTTPRTLAECQFMTGYGSVPVKRSSPIWIAAWFAAFAAIGVILAWGV